MLSAVPHVDMQIPQASPKGEQQIQDRRCYVRERYRLAILSSRRPIYHLYRMAFFDDLLNFLLLLASLSCVAGSNTTWDLQNDFGKKQYILIYGPDVMGSI